MKKIINKILKFIVGRTFITSFLILIQVVILAVMLIFLNNFYAAANIIFILISISMVVVIINRNSNPMFKLAWLIPILSFPVFGGLFYLFFGRSHLNKKNQKKLEDSLATVNDHFKVDESAIDKLNDENPYLVRQARFLTNASKSNLYMNTQTSFLAPGSKFFDELVICLKQAERYIFLEYFIITEGRMWNTILSILEEKAKQGVEVRIIYDDIGTIQLLPKNYPDILKEKGIKASVFNPFKPSLDIYMNYRDHRKIAVIDGKVGFTGGINIGDEYINEVIRYGYWHDASIKLNGDAVEKLIIMFLQMWHFSTGEEPLYQDYFTDYKQPMDGYVIPFSDEPVTQSLVTQNVYLDIINNAHDYVYICTPYLILDDEMTSSLIRTAQSGVDVCIITPHHPDKKIVHLMTRSNYIDLILSGVKIYEFTPGFIHSKTIVSDDEVAVVGTTNFDYRSFYLHFENNVWMYKSRAVMQTKTDHLAARKKSHLITKEEILNEPRYKRILSALIKVFSPLM